MGTVGTAVLSPDQRYRYRLARLWDPARLVLGFVMLNPSTADAGVDDPTIRRCAGFARREGYGGIVVANLYAFRATKPAELWLADDPVGPENDQHLGLLLEAGAVCGFPVVAAWGANARPDRVAAVRALPHAGVLHHLGLTTKGAPRHPLYLPGTAPLSRWAA